MTNRFLSIPGLLVCAIAPEGFRCLAGTPQATTTTLALSSSSVSIGAVVTLTATVTAGGARVSRGLVILDDGKTVIGSAQLIAGGTAATKIRLGLGAHSVTANFAGTNAYARSTSSAQTLKVTGLAPTATAIKFSGGNNNYALTGLATSFGWAAPTGMVSFLDQTSSTALGALALGAGSEAFQPQQTYYVNYRPQLVAVADFNGDGIPDLAAANDAPSGTVSVLIGQGDGTFQVAQNYPTGSYSQFVVVGDFNSDGFLDLAAPNAFDDTISVLLGNGDGTFQAQKTYAVGSWPQYAAVGDFNRDGIPDLATANLYSGTVSVLIGNGDGTFKPQQSYAAGVWPSSVEVGDFRGNGIADLVVTNYLNATIGVLLGNGDGTFQGPQTYPVGSNPQNTAQGDFNGDGILDLAVSNEFSYTVSVLLGNGNGTFQPQKTFPVSGTPNFVVAADFNGDGILDLATPNSGGNFINVLLGNGNGAFQVSQIYTVGPDPVSMAVGDFNGDGLPDLVTANQNDIAATLTVLLNGVTASTAALENVSIPGTLMQSAVASYGGDSGHQLSVSPAIGLTLGGIRSLTFSPPVIAFGNEAASQSNPGVVTVTNNGAVTVYGMSVSLDGLDPNKFSETTTCGASLAVGDSCTASVTFLPTSPISYSALLDIHSEDASAPEKIPLTGTGRGVRNLTFSATSLSFGGVTPGATSAPQILTITNNGSAGVYDLSVSLDGADRSRFAETTTCGASLAAGASCTVSVTYTPASNITSTAELRVQSDAPDAPATITLTGAGT